MIIRSIVNESKEIIAQLKCVKEGENVVTSPGFLDCNFLIHAVGPIYNEVIIFRHIKCSIRNINANLH